MNMNMTTAIKPNSTATSPDVSSAKLAIARNLGFGVEHFTTANLDQLPHYRPRVNVLERPAGGLSLDLRGHHEILVPLLRWLLIDPPPDFLRSGESAT